MCWALRCSCWLLGVGVSLVRERFQADSSRRSVLSDHRWSGLNGIIIQGACELCRLHPLACGASDEKRRFPRRNAVFFVETTAAAAASGGQVPVLLDGTSSSLTPGFLSAPFATPNDCACHAHLPRPASSAGQQNALRHCRHYSRAARQTVSNAELQWCKRLACRR